MRKLIFLLLLPATLMAQREPVLKQIDLPHPYYYREMYLPQLTSGPSWVTWSPDSKEVIYSMAGSLWRQKTDSTEAVQLTNGPGYDYQPDWSHDGKYVVYTKYHQDAMELWLLELASGKTRQLTKDSAVNVEPRWSPEGKRIAYVSTALTKHFHIFLLEMDGGLPKRVCPYMSPCDQPSEKSPLRQLTKENVSTLPRYYYSKFDHEISPAWSPDGKDIIFVSNHGHIHGTGGIWRATVPETGMIDTNTNAKEIHYEETNWKARPEFSPDGKKIVYASYLGRQWHQLWLMPSNGGDVFPLTYGEYDNINPRWSPDGATIASVSNRHFGWIVFRNSSTEWDLKAGTPHNWGKVFLGADDLSGIRIRLNDSVRLTSDSFLHADDSFDRKRQTLESHYFSSRNPGFAAAAGGYSAMATRGLDYKPVSLRFSVTSGATQNISPLKLERLRFRDTEEWTSGDLHIHRNYGGSYQYNQADFDNELDSEGVAVGWDLLVNKEQRFPNLSDSLEIARPKEYKTLIATGQEFHTSYWGHLGLLNINHLIVPGYAGYPNTAAASLVPMDADVADMAHAQNKDALVGWVHPFDVLPDPYKDPKLTNELPIDVALGKVDYYEVVGFSDHKASAAIWYRLLNLGFRLPAGAGTDAMTNFASLRGPVGLNRVYVRMDDEKQVPRLAPLTRDDNSKAKSLDLELWLHNLKAGKTFATNGPLLRFTLGEQPIGGEVKLDKPREVRFTGALRSIVPVDKVEVVCNGAVVKTIFPPDQRSGATPTKSNPRSFAPASRAGDNAREPSVAQDDIHKKEGQVKDSQGHVATTSLDVSGTVPISMSGWCVLRAYSDHAEEPIMDIYPYGTTSPIYVTVADEKPRSPEDAKFFSKWIERVREDAAVHPDYNTPQEREHVLKVLDDAAQVYAGMER